MKNKHFCFKVPMRMYCYKCILLFSAFIQISQGYSYDRNFIIDYIKYLGYPLTIYDNITTTDGYLLRLFRINKMNENYKGTIFLMHGLFTSGEVWFANEPRKTLPLLLADDGYDIWIANSRGCYQSLGHVRWNSSDPFSHYWNFSFHEIGVYDQPALLDFIFNVTKCEKVTYIGVSQGVATFFVMNSMLPEYNKKFNAMFTLGATVISDNALSPLCWVSRVIPKVIRDSVPYIGLTVPIMNDLAIVFCTVKEFQNLCLLALGLLTGRDEKGFNTKQIPYILRWFPSGSSMKIVLHFMQIIQSGKFALYDYKPDKNLKYYGSIEPPEYDLSKITSKVFLYYSLNDWLSSDKDVERLHQMLPNSELVPINYTKFSHVDYIVATHVNKYLFNDIRHRIAAIEDKC